LKRVAGKDGNLKLGFAVTDTGRGINVEQSIRLFEAFSQADSSITRKYGGTGLGLALSRKLANELGGDIEISQSELGLGSTFTVTIDPGKDAWKKLQTPSAEPSLVKKTLPEVLPVSFNDVSVLLVEDAPENQLLVSIMLQTVGVKVVTASDGREGVAKARAGYFDIILMDLQMPEMDGYAATKELRSKGYHRPIVALTAHAFDGHMTKPISRKTLLQCLVDFGKGKSSIVGEQVKTFSASCLRDGSHPLDGIDVIVVDDTCPS
jgi:CheY-like chemotaxis protein